MKPYDSTTPVHFTEDEIAESKDYLASPDAAVNMLRLIAMRALLSIERLREAIWPGLPEWQPTAAHPQQDFHEAVCESSRPTLRPASEYHEDYGEVLWFHLPLQEPPYVGSGYGMGESNADGTPTDCRRLQEEGWLTHWVPLPTPRQPVQS